MIEKFACAGDKAVSEFLDLNHTGNSMILVSLLIAKFAPEPNIEYRRTSQSGHQAHSTTTRRIGMSLKGKTAVVTGSTSGIGHGIAHALATDGANIVMNGLGTEKDNEKAIAEIKKLGTRVSFDPANMLRHNQIADMIAKAEKDFGSVDILVNNAGIQHVAPIEEFPIEQWDSIIAINLTSAFHTIRAAVPGMKKRKWGRIINICSAHSLRASPFKAAYVSAKHGLAGLTKTVALELAEHGVTSNAISPGFVWTPLVEKQIPDLAKSENITLEQAKNEVLSRQPTKQFVTVEQVAALAAFLASEVAASITGANYSIDGGWTAQ
jgi:3-hydroxybutyrate dehydrogenase